MDSHLPSAPGESWSALPPPREEWPYRVSSHGRIWSLSSRRLRVLRTHKSGYVVCNLCFRGEQETVRVHCLVLEAFAGPAPPGKPECRHLDDVQTNNNLANLRWGSRSDNARDSIRNGRQVAGERHPRSKVSDQLWSELRQELELGRLNISAVAIVAGLTVSSVHSRLRTERRRMRLLASPPTSPERRAIR